MADQTELAEALNEEPLSSRQLVYVEALKAVFVALGGNQLTVDSATKETETLLYCNTVQWINNFSRANHIMSEDFSKRKHLFRDWFDIEEFDDRMMTLLKKTFHINPSEAECRTTYNFWKTIKSDCRNEFGSSYSLQRAVQLKGYKSGNYNDDDIILNILEQHIIKSIDENFRKAMSNYKADLKKKQPKFTEDELNVAVRTKCFCTIY